MRRRSSKTPRYLNAPSFATQGSSSFNDDLISYIFDTRDLVIVPRLNLNVDKGVYDIHKNVSLKCLVRLALIFCTFYIFKFGLKDVILRQNNGGFPSTGHE